MMNNFKSNMIIAGLWIIISLVVTFLLSLYFSMSLVSEDKIEFYTFLSNIILFFILGFLTGNIKAKSGLVNGIIFATVMVMILIVITIFTKEISLQFSQIVRYIIMILSGGLGGIIGVNFKPLVKTN